MKLLYKFRFWVLKKIFSDDEKYLLIRCIETRCEYLDSYLLKTNLDPSNMRQDIKDLKKLKEIFSTKDYA